MCRSGSSPGEASNPVVSGEAGGSPSSPRATMNRPGLVAASFFLTLK